MIPGVALGLAIIAGACGSGPTNPTAGESASVSAESVTVPVAPDTAPAATATAASVSTSAPTTTSTGTTRTMVLSFTGDTLPHSPLWRGAASNAGGNGYDFFPMFASIAPIIERADLATCHLETPIAPEGEEFTTDPLYGVPPQIVTAMAQAGYDRCSTASNHVLDRGVDGIDRTVDVLTEHGMGQAGMARTEVESLPAPFDVNGISLGHLSYTYGTNGIPVPGDEPWRTGLIDPERIIRDARSARDLGADVVVVSLHWGTEAQTEPNDEQLSVADEITASGVIDLIIGHHAHVVQPISKVNNVWVAYGLGNILSNLPVSDFWPASSQDAAIVEFEIAVDDAGTVVVDLPRVTPTWVDKQDGWVIRDVAAELRRSDLGDARRDELQRSFDRTAAVLGQYISN